MRRAMIAMRLIFIASVVFAVAMFVVAAGAGMDVATRLFYGGAGVGWLVVARELWRDPIWRSYASA